MKKQSAVTLALIAAASMAACSAQPGAPGETVSASQGVSTSPSPALEASPDPTVVASEEAITYPPDNVWRMLATAAGSFSGATDTSSATKYSDSVVVGQLVSIEAGEGYGPNENEQGWYAMATVEVREVLGGKDPGATFTLPFLLVFGGDRYPSKELADFQRSIPKDPAVLFLVSWESYFDNAQAEVPGWLKGLDRPDYYRTIGVDGAIRVVDGKLDPPTHEESWTLSLKGATLEDVTEQVEAAAAGG